MSGDALADGDLLDAVAVGIAVTWERGVRPDVVRVATDVSVSLATTAAAIGAYLASPFSRNGYEAPLTLFSLRVDLDKYLPRGVWRLCDADETLLYDCREGKAP